MKRIIAFATLALGIVLGSLPALPLSRTQLS